MNPVFEQMSRIGIIPVIALDDAGDAAPLAEALLNGGISCGIDSGGGRVKLD